MRSPHNNNQDAKQHDDLLARRKPNSISYATNSEHADANKLNIMDNTKSFDHSSSNKTTTTTTNFNDSIRKLALNINNDIDSLNNIRNCNVKAVSSSTNRFTNEIERELANLTLSIEKEMAKQQQEHFYRHAHQSHGSNNFNGNDLVEQAMFKSFVDDTNLNDSSSNFNLSSIVNRNNNNNNNNLNSTTLNSSSTATTTTHKNYGKCFKCTKEIFDRNDACLAIGNLYHLSCFTCESCGRTLRGKPFYNINNQNYCEEDYSFSGYLQNTEKCTICNQSIVDLILQACGKSYHPGCFRCSVCNISLDGLPFTLDINNRIFCIQDYYKKYAPKCYACKQSIIPVGDANETVRVVAMEKDFHLDCYACQDCGVQLSDENEKRCYPLDECLLCLSCHLSRLNNFNRRFIYENETSGNRSIISDNLNHEVKSAYVSQKPR